jgi:cytidylate kinase
MLGHSSRREAERLVAEGRVEVNGRRVTEVATLVTIGQDTIVVDNERLEDSGRRQYIALNKPRGVVTSVRDPHAERTVVQLVPCEDRLFPVGRLDSDSEGLILLTNDGAFANRVAHPRYRTEKEYLALVAEAPSANALRQVRQGVLVDGQRMRPLAVGVTSAAVPGTNVHAGKRGPTRNPDDTKGVWVRVVLHEGRNREVRRMLAAVGHQVLRLVRTRIGPVRLDKLAPGRYRHLSAAEIRALGRRLKARGQGPGEREASGVRGQEPEGRPGPGLNGQALNPDPRTLTPDPFVVAIDGPSAAGKTTVGTQLAQRLGGGFLDTGVLYRALTLDALRRGIDLHDAATLGALANEGDVQFDPSDDGEPPRVRVLCGGRDVTEAIHSPEVDSAVSIVAAHPEVRAALLPIQRSAVQSGPMVVAGRDIGTMIFPDARLKVFLDAAPGERARRRAAETAALVPSREVERSLDERDSLDRSRASAPLRPAPDAIVINTDSMSPDEIVEQIMELIRAREAVIG